MENSRNMSLSELQNTGPSADPLLEHSLKIPRTLASSCAAHTCCAVVSAGLSMVEFQGIKF